MTEPNPSTDAQPDSRESAESTERAETRIDWPAPGGDPAAGDPAAGDPAVGALLLRLGDVPELPVSSHGEVYAGLHDELAAALNEDVAGQGAGDTPR